MIGADREKFVKILIGMAELKRVKLSAISIELYWELMSDWTIEDFTQAAMHLTKTCQFFPEPKNFEDLRKAGRMTTGEAWSFALRWASTGDYRRDPPSGSPLIDACARALGGYTAIAMCESVKLHFLERRFCEHYEALQDASDARRSLPHIARDERLPDNLHRRIFHGDR